MTTLFELEYKKSILLEEEKALGPQGGPMIIFASQIKAKIEVIDREIKLRGKPAPRVKKEPKEKVIVPKIFISVTILDASIRQRARNETLDELRLQRAQKKHCEETILRLRNDKQTFRVGDLIGRAEESIVKISDCIKEIEEKIQEIDDGKYDPILLKEVNSNMELEHKKRAAAREKKEKNAPPPRPVFKYRKYAPAPPAANGVAFSPKKPFCGISHYEFNRELGRFYSDFEKFPQKLRERLDKMPCNRGFVWRGDYWYGPLPAKEPAHTVIVTERINTDGSNFEIHEHVSTPTDFTIYRNVTEYNRGRKHSKREVLFTRKK